MKTARLFALVLFAAPPVQAAEEYRVADPESFARAVTSARPGDRVVLQNGIWQDARLKVRAVGTTEAPITIAAETPGAVVFRGDSRLSLGGRHVVVEGFWFLNPEGEEAIELRTRSDELAEHCRITNCAVTEDGKDAADPKKSSRFLSLHGIGNRVDRCYFAGKTTEGPTLAVWLKEGIVAAHRIERNHFGPRPVLGRNGGETIRVGDSKTSMLAANCRIESNLFERCDGEAECISNKSCGNIYRHNRFEAVSGALTLRHGNGCRVENNVFLGQGARGTGGVRIIGEDHLVTGNRFQDLTGDDARSALCLMLGIPDSPRHGYFQVKRARVTENVFLNCKRNILAGLAGDKKATLPPLDTEIAGNTIQTNRGEAIEIRCSGEGIRWIDNRESPDRPEVGEPPPLGPVGPDWKSFGDRPGAMGLIGTNLPGV